MSAMLPAQERVIYCALIRSQQQVTFDLWGGCTCTTTSFFEVGRRPENEMTRTGLGLEVAKTGATIVATTGIVLLKLDFNCTYT